MTGTCQAGGVSEPATVTLWHPTGPQELVLVTASGWRAWPPRLPDQPIFYPVLNEDYATRIARGLKRHRQRRRARHPLPGPHPVPGALPAAPVGGQTILEYWIPAKDLPALNDAIVGRIELVASFSA